MGGAGLQNENEQSIRTAFPVSCPWHGITVSDGESAWEPMHGSNPIALAGGEGKKKKRSRGRHTTWPLDPETLRISSAARWKQLAGSFGQMTRIHRIEVPSSEDTQVTFIYAGVKPPSPRTPFSYGAGHRLSRQKLNERMVIWHTPVDQYHYKKSLLLDKVIRN